MYSIMFKDHKQTSAPYEISNLVDDLSSFPSPSTAVRPVIYLEARLQHVPEALLGTTTHGSCHSAVYGSSFIRLLQIFCAILSSIALPDRSIRTNKPGKQASRRHSSMKEHVHPYEGRPVRSADAAKGLEKASDRGGQARVGLASYQSEEQETPRFACPFSAHNPSRYEAIAGSESRRRACVDGPGHDINHLTEHLRRYHSVHQEPACRFCSQLWHHRDDARLDEMVSHYCNGHCSADQTQIRAQPEIMTPEQESRYTQLRRNNQSAEAFWALIYQRLFPECTSIPSPYYQYFAPRHLIAGTVREPESDNMYGVFTRPSEELSRSPHVQQSVIRDRYELDSANHNRPISRSAYPPADTPSTTSFAAAFSEPPVRPRPLAQAQYGRGQVEASIGIEPSAQSFPPSDLGLMPSPNMTRSQDLRNTEHLSEDDIGAFESSSYSLQAPTPLPSVAPASTAQNSDYLLVDQNVPAEGNTVAMTNNSPAAIPRQYFGMIASGNNLPEPQRYYSPTTYSEMDYYFPAMAQQMPYDSDDRFASGVVDSEVSLPALVPLDTTTRYPNPYEPVAENPNPVYGNFSAPPVAVSMSPATWTRAHQTLYMSMIPEAESSLPTPMVWNSSSQSDFTLSDTAQSMAEGSLIAQVPDDEDPIRQTHGNSEYYEETDRTARS